MQIIQKTIDRIEKYGGLEKLKKDLEENSVAYVLKNNNVGLTRNFLYKIKKAFDTGEEIVKLERTWQKENNKYNPQNQRKYSANDNYFEKETSNMAWILGILASDGTLSLKSNRIKITLNEGDRETLEKIKEEIELENPIKNFTSNKGYKSVTLEWYNKKHREDLSRYGIIPRKTKTFIFPRYLNKEYYRDFIRGYFDGDGSIQYLKGNNTLRFDIGAYNSDVLEVISNFFEENGIEKVKTQSRPNTTFHYFQYSTNASKKIFQLLYYKNCLCMKRKKDIFVEAIIKQQEQLVDKQLKTLIINPYDII